MTNVLFKKPLLATAIVSALSVAAPSALAQSTNWVQGNYLGYNKQACFTNADAVQLVADVVASGANTYVYHLVEQRTQGYVDGNAWRDYQCPTQDTTFARMEQVISDLNQHNIDVWVDFQGLTTEAPSLSSTNPDNGKNSKDSYIHFANEIGRLKDIYPNLKAYSIDDFSLRLSDNGDTCPTDQYECMTIAESNHLRSLAGIDFYPTVYIKKDMVTQAATSGETLQFDGILFPYIYHSQYDTTPGENFQLYRSDTLVEQIDQLKSMYQKPVYVDLYASTYDSTPNGNFSTHQSETEYVQEIAMTAREKADGLIMYYLLSDHSQNAVYGIMCDSASLPAEEHADKKQVMNHWYAQWATENFSQNKADHEFSMVELTNVRHIDEYDIVSAETYVWKDAQGNIKTDASGNPRHITRRCPTATPTKTSFDQQAYDTQWGRIANADMSQFNGPFNSVAMDIDGDDIDEVVSLYRKPGLAGAHVFNTNGATRSLSHAAGRNGATVWSGLNMDNLVTSAAGDFNGDGKDQLAMFFDRDNSRQQIWMAGQSGGSLMPEIQLATHAEGSAFHANNQTFNFDYVKHAVAGRFMSGNEEQLVTLYTNDQGYQGLFIFTWDNANNRFNHWKLATQIGTSQIDFSKIISVHAANVDTDERKELVILFDLGGATAVAEYQFDDQGVATLQHNPRILSTFAPDKIAHAKMGNFITDLAVPNPAHAGTKKLVQFNDNHDDLAIYFNYGQGDYGLFYLYPLPNSTKPFEVLRGDYAAGKWRSLNLDEKQLDSIISGNFHAESADDASTQMRDEMMLLKRN